MSKSQSTIRVLEKYATWLFASLIIMLSGVLLYIGAIVVSPYKDICLAVATSLVASVLFSFFYSSVAERHHTNALNEEIEKDVKYTFHSMQDSHKQEMEQITNTVVRKIGEMKSMQEVFLDTVIMRTVREIQSLQESHYYQITSHFRDLIPSDHFPATDQPDKRFNHVLTDALKHSRQYLFRGITARYVPSRLEATEHHNLTCQVLLIDPTRDDLLKLYVHDRFGWHLTDQEIHDTIQSVRREIYMTIVDLFSQARRTTIDIRMHQGPIFYRTEIVDKKMFVSFYTSKQATAFPITYVYEDYSFFYNTFLTDFKQTFDLAHIFTSFHPRSLPQDLTDFLQKIGCDVDTISQLRKEAEQFRKNFTNFTSNI